ncbi:MAG: RibD family protein [Myxococcales bacterium]|nr:MAG: RibD family protein [Myxococcales bacterium]
MTRPLVTLHFAQSLDGRIGLGPAAQRVILSGEEGVVCAHQARGENDAVLVGIETLLHDDPLLTARGPGAGRPLRVVLDSALRIPLTARLLAPALGAGAVVVLASAERASAERRRALVELGASVALLPADPQGRVSLPEALRALHERGVRRLLVEGGARVLTSFLRARLADRAALEIAPVWLGAEGTPALRELGVPGIAQAPRLEQPVLERVGSSFLLRGDIAYPAWSG